MSVSKATGAIDELMDRASGALAGTEYFEAEKLCVRAITQARLVRDFERMARICLPLQEARRQIRQLAESEGVRGVLDRDGAEAVRAAVREAGCYVLQPPLLGVDVVALRDASRRRRVPVHILAREPMTKFGKWPIVAVGESHLATGPLSMFSVRTQVDPPAGVTFTDKGPTRDVMSGVPGIGWFVTAGEAIGDAAIAKVDTTLPAAWQADDLLDLLDAIPEHEKLHQKLAEVCWKASREPAPKETRRPKDANPWSF